MPDKMSSHDQSGERSTSARGPVSGDARPSRADPDTPDKPTTTAHIKQNIESIAQLDHEFQKHRKPSEQLSAAVSRFAGSVRFVIAHAVLFFLWILSNHVLPERLRFDPTYTFLQVWAALEALFLAAFVLMSQNRQGRLVEHWAHVTLQISLLTEQEMTKMLQLQLKVCDSLGMRQAATDPQLAQMAKPTDVEALVAEVGKARAMEDELIAEIEQVVKAEKDKNEEVRVEPEEAGVNR